MTLKRKKRFFKRNSFWCQLHGIWWCNLHRINGDFVRFSKKCEIE